MAKGPRLQVKGVRAIIRALQQEKKAKAKGVERGLKRAGLLLLRESMKIVPVDTGALRNSAPNVTRAEGSGFDTVMIVGYGMDYAIYVHENLTARHKPGKFSQFLLVPARQNRKRMADIIKAEMLK